jgi:hypothetical protein
MLLVMGGGFWSLQVSALLGLLFPSLSLFDMLLVMGEGFGT